MVSEEQSLYVCLRVYALCCIFDWWSMSSMKGGVCMGTNGECIVNDGCRLFIDRLST